MSVPSALRTSDTSGSLTIILPADRATGSRGFAGIIAAMT